MADDNEPPKRAFTIRMSVGGDTLDDAVTEAERFLRDIRAGHRACLNGGCSTGGSYAVTERDVTPAQFTANLDAWLAKQ